MRTLKAFVETYYNPNDANLELGLVQGYTHTVVIVDAEDETDMIDMLDFKTEFAAQTYADSINLKGEHHA